MVVNIVLILYLIWMLYWWGMHQGAFSSLLNVIFVLLAGTVALAAWEPFSMLMLKAPASLTILREWAWGLSLLISFVGAFLLLRILGDTLVSGNVQTNNLVSQIFGGMLGIFAGILISGMTIISFGYMGGTHEGGLGGYDPLTVVEGEPQSASSEEGTDLWLGVDTWTAAVFNQLSRGALGSWNGPTLASVRPTFARDAVLHRMQYPYDPEADKHKSTQTASPNGVRVEDIIAWPTRQWDQLGGLSGKDQIVNALGPRLKQSGSRLVIIDTVWEKAGGTYDTDGNLRVSPEQVRLVTHDEDGDPKMEHPVAFSIVDPRSGRREFVPFRRTDVNLPNNLPATSGNNNQRIAWVFFIDEGRTLQRLYLRQLGFSLADPDEASPDRIVPILGDHVPDWEELQTRAQESPIKNQSLPGFIALTSQLPGGATININATQNLNFTDPPDAQISSGQGTVVLGDTFGRERTAVERIFFSASTQPVRIHLAGPDAGTAYGQAYQFAQDNTGEVYVSDTRGEQHYPVAYVVRKAGEFDIFVVNPNQRAGASNPLRNAARFPVSNLGPDQQLYVYFGLPNTVEMSEFHFGGREPISFEPPE